MTTTFIPPRTTQPRPLLPISHANPLLKNIDRARLPPVKYQVITREGQEIIVGRIKIQTPNNGHAFILRRFDTGAISLTTMFRAAFPTATEESEKAEANWVRANYDLLGANGGAPLHGSQAGPKLRLAGTWVNPDIAMTIADVYALGHIVQPLATANPDPGQEYRRSTKASEAASSPQQPQNGTTVKSGLPTPPDRAAQPNPSKRRKESSPAPVATNGSSPVTPAPPLRTSRRKTPVPVMGSSVTRARSSTRPTTRAAQQDIVVTTTQTVVTEEVDDEEIAEVPGPDPKADIEEQKALISRLKAERSSGGVSSSSAEGSTSTTNGVKRSHDEAEEETKEVKFEPKEPEVEERRIITNRRITLQPEQKSAIWGAALFAVGFAAMATLPAYFF